MVAGGTGLVGSNLLMELGKRGLPFAATRHQNSASPLAGLCQPFDLTKFEDCLEATQNKSAVVLAAAMIFSAAQARKNPTAAILPNLKINAGLMEAAARNGVKSLVVLSSTSVYQDADYAINEEQLDLNQIPHPTYLGVGGYNRYLESLARVYAETHGMRVVILRPSAVYGPFDNFGSENAHVIPALIDRALAGEDPFEVWGLPEVVRDFVFAPDLAKDIIQAVEDESIPSGTAINAGGQGPVTIGQVVEMVLRACGREPDVFYNLDRPTTIPYRAVDMSRHKRLLGKDPRTSLQEGIEQTVRWHLGRKKA